MRIISAELSETLLRNIRLETISPYRTGVVIGCMKNDGDMINCNREDIVRELYQGLDSKEEKEYLKRFLFRFSFKSGR